MSGTPHSTNPLARRVLVFDRDNLFRELLVNSLTLHGFDVVGASDPQVAWSELVAADPDAVVMDVQVSSCESGISLAEAMLEQSPGIGLVFLTDVLHPRVVDAERRNIPPGSAYLHKSSIHGMEEVVEALEAVLHERSEVPRHDLLYAASWSELSAQQIEVLHLIAQGYSNKEIAEQRGTQVRSVEALIGRTFEQLNIDSFGREGNRRVLAARHFILACGQRAEARSIESV